MKSSRTVVWSPRYEVDLGVHVFPTAKYRLVRDHLVEAGVLRASDLVEPAPASDAQLLRVHTAAYLDKIRRNGFSMFERYRLEVPFTAELASAMRLCCGGTVLTARRALEEGVAVHLGGGFHHAFPEHGEGFCLLNDVAVAAADLLADGTAGRVLVVDLDVHQGNGTARIFADEPRVFTFSMHQDANYPSEKPPSDLDVGLPNGMADDAYLGVLDAHLPELLDDPRPDLVLYLAGADPYEQDQLGGLRLTLQGLRRRDRVVLGACRERGVPVAVTLAGGYAVDTRDTIRIHAATVEEALEEGG